MPIDRLSVARLRALFELSPISMLIYDRDGRPARVNRAFTQQWGLTLDDLADYRILEDDQLVAQGVMPLVRQAFAGATTVLPPFLYDAAALRAHGTTRWAQAYLYPITDVDGAVSEVVLMHVDITALKAAELLARGQTTVLTESLRQLAGEPHLPVYLTSVLRAVMGQTGATAGYILSANEREDLLAIQAALREGAPGAEPIADDLPPLGRLATPERTRALAALRTARTPLRLGAWAEAPQFWPGLAAWHQAQGHREVLIMALLAGETFVGALGLGFPTPAPLTPDAVELLHALAAQAALALQLTQLAERGRRVAALAERTRLAREIHDTLAQGLMGIIVQLQAAADAHTPAGDQRAHLDQALALARASLAEARRSVQVLRAPSRGDEDLGAALMRQIQQIAASTGVNAAFALSGAPIPLAPAVAAQLMRISQEAISNALRHARAQHLQLDLAFAPGRVRLQIRDDGVGFAPDTVAPDRFGLVGMYERAAQLGAQLELRTAPGQGTMVVVEVPLGAPGRERAEDDL